MRRDGYELWAVQLNCDFVSFQICLFLDAYIYNILIYKSEANIVERPERINSSVKDFFFFLPP